MVFRLVAPIEPVRPKKSNLKELGGHPQRPFIAIVEDLSLINA